MWITDDESLCSRCVHLEHECGVEVGDDYFCIENCDCIYASARDKFYEFDEPITECSHFEE